MTAELVVVLLRTKEDGNVGAVARAGRNFGIDGLRLVAPRAPLGPDARRRAMAGLPLLRGAAKHPTLDAAVADCDFVVGTTDLSTGRSASYLRRSISPEQLGGLLPILVGRVALVFGPEDNGLSRAELSRCDLLVHIPARRDFPTLNLSHAVAVALYAIHRAKAPEDPESTPEPEEVRLDGRQKELLLARLTGLVRETEYPAHKRKGLNLLFRRVLGRARPGEPELRMLLGFVKSVERRVRARSPR